MKRSLKYEISILFEPITLAPMVCVQTAGDVMIVPEA